MVSLPVCLSVCLCLFSGVLFVYVSLCTCERMLRVARIVIKLSYVPVLLLSLSMSCFQSGGGLCVSTASAYWWSLLHELQALSRFNFITGL